MFKVTYTEQDNTTARLKIEGRIAGEWVNELKKECELCLKKRDHLILDLSGVSFVDEKGIRGLKAMIGERVRLIGCSLFLSGLLTLEECQGGKSLFDSSSG
jgi:anti-anti-sigma regulatory factor